MAYFNYDGKEVYYEIHGQGKPLLILNGIMMSTKSWSHFVEDFSKDNMLVLLDFLDQGLSSKIEGDYTHHIQVDCVEALCHHLNLDSLNLFGISYGGEIAIQFALKYPHRIHKLLLFNTTAWTSDWLEEVGNAWNLAAYSWESYYATTIPVIYSPQFYVREIEWIKQRKEALKEVFSNQEFIRSMIRLTNSSIGYDVRNSLSQIRVPCLIVSSEFDFVTPIHEQKLLAEKIPNSHWVTIPNVGHASMYESPEIFKTLVLGFVNK